MNIPERMETERLIIRPYRAGDGPMCFAASLRNREHLAEYESDNVLMHLRDEAHSEEIVRELGEDWKSRSVFFAGLFQKDTNAWVGQLYIGPSNWDLPEYMIGFAVDVDHEGQGLISEAVRAMLQSLFTDFQAHRVISSCHEDNVRSQRVLERSGFRKEGHLRQNRKNPDGSYHGDFLYGLLRDEYFNAG